MTIAVIRTGGSPVIRLGENTGEAARQANRATSEADAAEGSAAVALAAAGPNYASTAAGLAATSEGDTFAVEADGIVTVYRHDSGPTATELRVLPTTAALASTATGKGISLTVTEQGDNGQNVLDNAKLGATARRQNPANDAYSSVNTPAPSPTDDAAKLQAALDEAENVGRTDLAVGGLGCSISSGLRYKNAFGPIVGNPYTPICAAPSSTIDAMLAPSVWEEDSTDFPAAAFADKINSFKQGISLDGNISNGATVSNGYIAIPQNSVEIGFKIRNVSGTGYRLTHRNKADDASTTGNLLFNRMYGHSVENPTDEPSTYGYHFGAQANGKLTEGDPLCIHSYSTKTAAYIGSAQGWMYMFGRHAVTDDGIHCYHANRTWFYGTVVDEFGYGHDTGKTSFTGIHLGSLTDTEGANQGLLGGTILSRADAGDTSSFTYTGLSFQAAGDAGGLATIIADAHIHLAGSSAHTRGIVQVTDSGNVEVAGTIHDVHISGGYTGETVETPLTLLSPYVKAHHVSHGKELAFEGRNIRGHRTRNFDGLDSLGGVTSDRCELHFSKAGVSTGSAQNFATVTIFAAGAMLIEVEVVAINATTSNGYVTRSTKVVIPVQRHSSGSNPVAGSVVEIFDSGSATANAGVRDFTDIAVTATASASGVTLAVNITASGSSAPATADIVYNIRTIGQGSSSGIARIDPA